MSESQDFILIGLAGSAQILGARIRELRLIRKWTQQTLADRAGVTLASLQRFERTGKCSLELLLRTAQSLGRLDEFADLLTPPPAASIAELQELSNRPKRKRGSV